MERARYQFADLETLPDQLFACLNEWMQAGNGLAEPLLAAQVALYEWMANLVQHACFGNRTPLVALELEVTGQGVRCVVEDNSDGFDLPAQLAQRRTALRPMPERGMGLLLLHATAMDIRYDSTGPHQHRLSFHIPVQPPPAGLDLTADAEGHA